MTILKKYIGSSFLLCWSFLLVCDINAQSPKLFINGKHEYKKYSAFDLYNNKTIINSKTLDSLHQVNANIPVRLKITIGNDTLWSDTFNIKTYYKITEIITGFSNKLNTIKKQINVDEESFMKANNESYLPFILEYYKIIKNRKQNQRGLKYFVVKVDNSDWIICGFKYSSYW